MVGTLQLIKKDRWFEFENTIRSYGSKPAIHFH